MYTWSLSFVRLFVAMNRVGKFVLPLFVALKSCKCLILHAIVMLQIGIICITIYNRDIMVGYCFDTGSGTKFTTSYKTDILLPLFYVF